MTYWRVAIPVWVVVSIISYAISMDAGHSVGASLGWAVGWFTVVLGLRWFIVALRPSVKRDESHQAPPTPPTK